MNNETKTITPSQEIENNYQNFVKRWKKENGKEPGYPVRAGMMRAQAEIYLKQRNDMIEKFVKSQNELDLHATGADLLLTIWNKYNKHFTDEENERIETYFIDRAKTLDLP